MRAGRENVAVAGGFAGRRIVAVTESGARSARRAVTRTQFLPQATVRARAPPTVRLTAPVASGFMSAATTVASMGPPRRTASPTRTSWARRPIMNAGRSARAGATAAGGWTSDGPEDDEPL